MSSKEATATDLRPTRPSAAVVLLRGQGESLETFWVLRSDAVRYMPEFRAFPGGTADADDAGIVIEGIESGTERTARACALREVFEETGILLADSDVDAPTRDAARDRLLEGRATFAEMVREHGWRFRADALVPAGRWVSPAFAATRFETEFFLARLTYDQEPQVRPGELASGEWISPLTALQRWQAGTEAFAAPVLYTMIALGQGEEDLPHRLTEWPEASGKPVRRIELKWGIRSEEHTSELQSLRHLVCRLLL